MTRPDQIEAETLIVELHRVFAEYYHRPQDGLLRKLATKAADALITALRERDEAHKAVSHLSQQAHLEWTRAEKAERERDEAKLVIAELRDVLSMAHEQMSELDDLQAGQQDQITTLRKLLGRYLGNHCANADAEGASTLCECKLCLDTRAVLVADRSPNEETQASAD